MNILLKHSNVQIHNMNITIMGPSAIKIKEFKDRKNLKIQDIFRLFYSKKNIV